MKKTSSLDPTSRFSDRVDDYVRARPSYPLAILDLLEGEHVLVPGMTVADVGSGTGIFSALLLGRGYPVFGIEPNAGMRAAAEKAFRSNKMFTSVDGTAEHTTLPGASVRTITAAQSFHWFDVERCRQEFQRVLQPQGAMALVWNERDTERTQLARGYQALIDDYATDYSLVQLARHDPARIARLFAPRSFKVMRFPNAQRLDYAGLEARLVSASYMPKEGHPRFREMVAALRQLFDAVQNGGLVTLEYTTEVYWGHLG